MQSLGFPHRASTTASLCIPTCSGCVCVSGNAACGRPTSQGGPGLDHASISMTHLASFMQLAESETHEEHGVDAAQHPGQLLLVCLQQQDSFPLFVPWLSLFVPWFPFFVPWFPLTWPLISLFCHLVSLFCPFCPCYSSYVQDLYMSACSMRTASPNLPAAMGQFPLTSLPCFLFFCPFSLFFYI